MSEADLKAQVHRNLGANFTLREEVRGHHAFYDKQVRADFLAYPTPALIEAGFRAEWFAIECKWAEGVAHQTSQTTRAVWQCLTYAQSHFETDGAQVVPTFVLLFTPDRLERLIERHLKSLLALAYYGNVGTLYFYRSGDWGIKFIDIYSRRHNGHFIVKANKLPRPRAGSV